MFKKVVGLLFVVMLTLGMSTVVFASELIEGDYEVIEGGYRVVRENERDFVSPHDRSVLEREAYVGVADIAVYTYYCPEGTVMKRTAIFSNLIAVPTSDLFAVMDYLGVDAPISASEYLAVMDSLGLTSARCLLSGTAVNAHSAEAQSAVVAQSDLECATVMSIGCSGISLSATGRDTTAGHLTISNRNDSSSNVSGIVNLLGAGHGQLVGQSNFNHTIASWGSRVHTTHATLGTWWTMFVSTIRIHGVLVPDLWL